MSSAIFLLVKTGRTSLFIFFPRSDGCLRTMSADLWSLNGRIIRTGAFPWTSRTCCWFQTTVNKSTMRCLQIQMWSVWCGLCWLYSPTPFPTHCWTQALSYWKTPAWLSQSGEQRPHWTIHYTEEMSWEIWMLDLRNAFYPGKETQTEHSIRLNKSETF